MKNKKIEAGDIISCPECNLLIAKFNTDVHKGETLSADLVTSYIGDLTNGMPMLCPKCHASFFDSKRLMIHLSKKGWF